MDRDLFESWFLIIEKSSTEIFHQNRNFLNLFYHLLFKH